MAENSIRREGRVKRIEYLRYLASIEEIREEFVRVSEFDSIYLEI